MQRRSRSIARRSTWGIPCIVEPTIGPFHHFVLDDQVEDVKPT